MQEILLFMRHHAGLTSALIAILIILFILEFIKLKRKTSQLSPQQLVQMINRENAVVVDIRTTEAYTNGHIVDSHAISFPELGDKIKKLEKFKSNPIVIVCALGNDSLKAVDIVSQKGFPRVYALAGGMKAWKMADLPTIKG